MKREESFECIMASLLSQLKWLLMLMYRSGSMSLHLWPQLDSTRLSAMLMKSGTVKSLLAIASSDAGCSLFAFYDRVWQFNYDKVVKSPDRSSNLCAPS